MPGFWRENIFSEHIYPCNKALNSCKGGYDNLCNEYYSGIKCEACIQNKENEILQKSFSGSCSPCPPIWVLIIIINVILVFSSIFLMILIFIIQQPSLPINLKCSLKTLINYFQYFIITQTYESSLPIYLRDFLSYSGLMSKVGAVWFSTECIIKKLNYDYGPHIDSIIIQNFFIFTTALSYLFYKFTWHFYRYKKISKNISWKCFALTSFYLYSPSLLEHLISNVVCEEIGGAFVNKKFLDYRCYDKSYYFWLILFYIPSILIISALPHLLYISLSKIRLKIIFFKKKQINIGSSEKKKFSNDFIYVIGSKGNYAILPEIYFFCIKILIILVNHTWTLESNVKNSLLLLIMMSSMLFTDHIMLRSFLRVYQILEYLTKISITAILYFLVWISSLEYEMKDSEHRNLNHFTIFLIMLLVQASYLLAHLYNIFLSLKCGLHFFRKTRNKIISMKF